MSDSAKRAADGEQAAGSGEQAGLELSWSSIFLLLAAAVILWGLSMALPGEEAPFIQVDTLENWVVFGQRILRDVLRAASILAAAMAASTFVPQIGLRVERWALGSSRRRFLGVTAGLAVLSSGLFSYFVLAHMPHIQDEIATVFQAKLLAQGRLYADTPELIDFFDWEFIVVDGPRWYGKYFVGPSLLLVPGVWLGAVWLVHPLLSGVAVVLVYAMGRALLNEKIARVAALLMVISPFRVSLFALMMAHASCLLSLGLFGLGMIMVVRAPQRPGWSLAAGAGLGFALNCRPLTALAMAVVVGLTALYAMPWRRLRWPTVLAFALPLAAFALVFLGYNRALSGDPLRTPFRQWSSTDRLGFGPDVGLEYWPEEDRGHSLREGLLRSSYFNLEALGTNLTGWGYAALLLLIWPIARSPWRKRSLALAGPCAGLIIAYLFYLTPSVLAGQARYWSEAMPMMMLLVAMGLVGVRRRVPLLCRWLGLLPAVRTGRSACWLAGVLLVVWSIPRAHVPLVDECIKDFWGQTSLLRDAAAGENLGNALVFVKSDHYRTATRKRRWDRYGTAFILNAPDLDGPVIWARDLGDERNAALIARYPGRSVYRVDPQPGEKIRFIPVSTAAARAAG